MRIQSLEHFIELARAGSFYHAARYSDLSVQGFAKMLSSLENELGVQLATRSKSGTRLTRAGEILFEESLHITESWDQAKARIEALKDGRGEDAENYKVYTTHYGMHVISQLGYVHEILTGYDLYEESFDKILIRAERADSNEFFIVDVFSDAAFADMERRGVAFEVFFESALGLLIRDDCPLARLDAISPSDIGTLKMSNYLHKEWNRLLERVLGKQSLESTLFESTAYNLLIAFVKAGADRGVLTDSLTIYGGRKNHLYDMSGLSFRPLKDNAARLRLGVLYRKDQEPSSKASAIVSTWHEYAKVRSTDYFDELARIYRAVGA